MIPWFIKNKIVVKHWIRIVRGLPHLTEYGASSLKQLPHEPSQSPVTELNTWIRLFPRSATHTWTPQEYRAVNTASVSYIHNAPDCWSAVRQDLKGEVHPQTKSDENMQIIWDVDECVSSSGLEKCVSAMDALQWMGAVRMRVWYKHHSTPVHQLTSGEDKRWN